MYYTQCYEDHNRGAEGGYGDFPLCSAELEVHVHTHTCLLVLPNLTLSPLTPSIFFLILFSPYSVLTGKHGCSIKYS